MRSVDLCCVKGVIDVCMILGRHFWYIRRRKSSVYVRWMAVTCRDYEKSDVWGISN